MSHPADTKANRAKQYQSGLNDAKGLSAYPYGKSNEFGAISIGLQLSYDKGWAKGRGVPLARAHIEFKTNNVPRMLLFFHELTQKERAELDYVTEDTNSFFRHKGQVYDMGEFARILAPENMGNPLAEHPMCLRDYKGEFDAWDCYKSDTFFSGMVARYTRDENGDFNGEEVVVGTFFCSWA